MLSPCDNVHTEYPREWVWSRSGKAASCIPRQLEYSEVARVLGKKRVALVGDSHLRKLYGYMGKFLEGGWFMYTLLIVTVTILVYNL